MLFFFSSRRRHTRCALVTGVQTCALPILALGPGARCAAGFLFGMTLAAAGERLRRRPLQRAIAAIGPNYLPPALTAAGVASAFGSLYAAYGLYGLLPPLAAFLLLALVDRKSTRLNSSH